MGPRRQAEQQAAALERADRFEEETMPVLRFDRGEVPLVACHRAELLPRDKGRTIGLVTQQ